MGAPGIDSSQNAFHSVLVVQDNGNPHAAVRRMIAHSKCFFNSAVHASPAFRVLEIELSGRPGAETCRRFEPALDGGREK